MAITLITGVPGAGKTLLAVKAIYDQVKLNNNPSTPPERRRPIYTDIDGIDFGADVEFFDGDWRTLPDGSLVVFDEVHRRWPATGRSGMSADETCSQLDTHRHRGFDFYLITQWPTKLHFEARTNVTKHMHLVRHSGAKSATIYTWQQAQGSPDSRESKDLADTEAFLYPRHLFKHYKSATIHTHRFKIPKKLIFIGLLLLVVVVLIWRIIAGGNTIVTGGFGGSDKSPVQVAELLPPAAQATPAAGQHGYKQQLAGCISNALACMCYTADGQTLDIDLGTCKNIMEQPLPYPLTIDSSSSNS